MKCKNCGAMVGKGDTACARCGAMQYQSVKRIHGNWMTREHDFIADPEEEMGRSFAGNFIQTCLKMVLLIILAILFGYIWYRAEHFLKQREEQNYIQEVKRDWEWYEENIDQLNAYYQMNEFSEIEELVSEDGGRWSALQTWPHQDILAIYRESQIELDRLMKDVEKKEYIIPYHVQKAICESLILLYGYEKNGGYFLENTEHLSDEEKECLEKWRENADYFLRDMLSMTQGEIDQALDLVDDGSPYFFAEKLDEFAKTYYERLMGIYEEMNAKTRTVR